MARKSKEEAAQAAADKQWRKVLADHAEATLRGAVRCAAEAYSDPTIRNTPDQGGLVVEIRGPDGEWRRYFARLTEVRS